MGDKQTQAVIFNFKEQRRLEKNLQMLKIEEAYAISLINLNNKVLKIGYKRLKDRVSKTKSHLTNDQINEMKKLEESGEIKEKVIKMESEIRISAAEKRLKLWSDKKARSVTPRVQIERFRPEQGSSRRSSMSMGTHSMNSTLDIKNIKEVKAMRRQSVDIRDSLDAAKVAFKEMDKKLSKSQTSLKVPNCNDKVDENTHPKRKVDIKTDAFMSPVTEEPMKRRKSVVEIRIPSKTDTHGSLIAHDDASQFDKESRPILKHPADLPNSRPVSIMKPANMLNSGRSSAVPFATRNASIRPQTGGLHPQSSKSFNKKRPSTSLIRASRDKSNMTSRLSQLITRTPFSSHDTDQKDKKGTLETPFRSIREGTMTAFDERSIDKDVGEEVYKEIKKELLRKEAVSSLHIEDKIDDFFDKVDEYLHGKATDHTDEIKMPVPIFSKAAREEKKSVPKRNRMRRRKLEFAIHGNKSSDDRLQEAWKDVNKCRYLRVPEAAIDLTGIQTLASEQLKLFEALRHGNY